MKKNRVASIAPHSLTAGGPWPTVALQGAAQDGHSGLPVTSAPAQLWLVASIVSPARVGPGTARLLAATADADPLLGQPCATRAEDAEQMNVKLTEVMADITG